MDFKSVQDQLQGAFSSIDDVSKEGTSYNFSGHNHKRIKKDGKPEKRALVIY